MMIYLYALAAFVLYLPLHRPMLRLANWTWPRLHRLMARMLGQPLPVQPLSPVHRVANDTTVSIADLVEYAEQQAEKEQ